MYVQLVYTVNKQTLATMYISNMSFEELRREAEYTDNQLALRILELADAEMQAKVEDAKAGICGTKQAGINFKERFEDNICVDSAELLAESVHKVYEACL